MTGPEDPMARKKDKKAQKDKKAEKDKAARSATRTPAANGVERRPAAAPDESAAGTG